MKYRMKVGDLEPALRVLVMEDSPEDVLTGRNPRRKVPMPLDTAQQVNVVGTMDDTVLFNRAASGDASGFVMMDWQAPDTDETGTIRLEVKVLWDTDRPQTVPLDDTVVVYD